MEGELAHIGAGLAAIGSGAAAIGVGIDMQLFGRRIAQPICSSITNSNTVHRFGIRRSIGDLRVPRIAFADVRCLRTTRKSLRLAGHTTCPASNFTR